MNLSIIAKKLANEMGIEHSILANQSVINSKKLFNLSV